MDSCDLDPELRAAGVEPNAAPALATRASVEPGELHTSLSEDCEGKTHRLSQWPLVIRRLG